MPERMVGHLEQAGAGFYRWIAVPGVVLPVVRLVTSFATTEAEVERLLAEARAGSPAP